MVWFWPQFGDIGYDDLISSMPPELIALMGSSGADLGTLGGYFETEYLGLMWMLIVSSAVILYAMKAVAGEVSAGTMELTLAQPVSRMSLIVTRIAGLVVVSAALVVATIAPIQLLGPGYDIDISARAYALLYGVGMLFVLAVGGIALALSAGARESGKPTAIVGGLLGGMWIMHVLAEVSDLASWFEPLNLLKYWRPADIINEGAVTPEVWWVYAGVVAATFAIAVVRFVRRDVA